MRKYIIIGLVILIGSNVLALSGVVYNRMGEPKVNLTLSEREFSLRGNSIRNNENSGMSLRLKWRTPQEETTEYYFNHHEVSSSREALEFLGFSNLDEAYNYRAESLELYWAMELNGESYLNEVAKAQKLLRDEKAAIAEQNSANQNQYAKDKVKRLTKRAQEAQHVDSRLFFLEASASYETLLEKYESHENVFVIKGIAKPFLDGQNDQYRLILQHALGEEIMVSTDHSDSLKKLESHPKNALRKPRFNAQIAWGKKLEPWLVEIQKIAPQPLESE